MRIINKTKNTIYYQVTPSGCDLEYQYVVASGSIESGGTLKFPVGDIGPSPKVYVKNADPRTDGSLELQVKDGDSTVEVSMSEVTI
jgi:hypothetical protein